MRGCPHCGARTEAVACEELFERLLALDHSRQPLWGPLHAVAATCFFLQHPEHPLAPRGRNDPGWAVLHAYLTGGQQALDALTDAARRSNSRGHRSRGSAARPPFGSSPPMPDRPAPRAFKVTIADVAADGSFPAPGYEHRVRRWAEDTGRDVDVVRALTVCVGVRP